MWERCVLIRPFLKKNTKNFICGIMVQWSSLEKDLQNIMDCIKKFQTLSCSVTSVYSFFASSFFGTYKHKSNSQFTDWWLCCFIDWWLSNCYIFFLPAKSLPPCPQWAVLPIRWSLQVYVVRLYAIVDLSIISKKEMQVLICMLSVPFFWEGTQVHRW